MTKDRRIEIFKFIRKARFQLDNARFDVHWRPQLLDYINRCIEALNI